jgi:two-component system, OmpR family, phosphate regulon sensor histidine kinase PhoR
MSWLWPRLLVGLLAVAGGGMVGYLIGGPFDLQFYVGLLGGFVALGALAFRDTLRGVRLLNWLRDPQDGGAPRDAGFWGEIGYLADRSLRQREQDLAQEKLRLEQFLQAIDASPNGVLLLDAQGRIDWSNATAALHFGIDAQRDRLQHLTNLVRAPGFVAYLQAGRFDEPVQFSEPRGAGLLSVMVREYGEGMRLVLSQDITERERTDAMRRDFVANVSHEIRTPLTVLSGFIETMATLQLTDVERKRVLHLMDQQATRMQTLVSDLLTLAMLEGSPRPTADRWVPVSKLLLNLEADARTLSQGHHTILLSRNGECQIAGAEAELLSGMGNLVGNAVRYTPHGGQVEISWRLLEDGSGEFAVKDNGPGVDREHIPRLTERFYRVDNSRSRDTGGTGLGLAIAKHVVQRHGGELDIQSEIGKGSLFRLVFPAARVRGAVPNLDRSGDAVAIHVETSS